MRLESRMEKIKILKSADYGTFNKSFLASETWPDNSKDELGSRNEKYEGAWWISFDKEFFSLIIPDTRASHSFLTCGVRSRQTSWNPAVGRKKLSFHLICSKPTTFLDHYRFFLPSIHQSIHPSTYLLPRVLPIIKKNKAPIISRGKIWSSSPPFSQTSDEKELVLFHSLLIPSLNPYMRSSRGFLWKMSLE